MSTLVTISFMFFSAVYQLSFFLRNCSCFSFMKIMVVIGVHGTMTDYDSNIYDLQMADPLTALMYAVQVMNFLKTLVIKTLREREESMVETNPISNLDSFDDDWHQSPSCLDFKDGNEGGNETSEEEEKVIVTEELSEDGSETESGSKTLPISAENIISQGNRLLVDSCPCNVISQVTLSGLMKADEANISLSKNLPLSRSNTLKYSEKVIELPLVGNAERNMVIPIFGRINSRTEWTEAWR